MRALLVLALASSAFGNGIVVETPRPEPLPPVRMKEHRVTAVIHDRAASVTVEQVFLNHSKSVLEGTYLFPLLRKSDRIANYLSVGEHVIVVLDGTACEIVPPT